MAGCLAQCSAKGSQYAIVFLLFTNQVFLKEVALQRCSPAPWGPDCGGAPGPAEWLPSSPHCWPSEYEAPREQFASVVLWGKGQCKKEIMKIEINVLKYRMFMITCLAMGNILAG